jgi:hypothetical protein
MTILLTIAVADHYEVLLSRTHPAEFVVLIDGQNRFLYFTCQLIPSSPISGAQQSALLLQLVGLPDHVDTDTKLLTDCFSVPVGRCQSQQRDSLFIGVAGSYLVLESSKELAV